MKILFVTPYFVPAWSYGGPVKVVFDLARYLQQEGHQVTVVTTDVLDRTHRHPEHQATIEGVRVIYFRNLSNRLAFRFNAYVPLGFSGWCRKYLADYEVIHCHDFFTWQNVVIAQQAPNLHRPFFVQPHGALNLTRMSGRLTFLKHAFLRLFRGVLSEAKKILVSTEIEKQEAIADVNPNLVPKTVVVPNGIPLGQLTYAHPDSPIRAEFGLAKDELFIIYFGRWQYIKGIDLSLKGLAMITRLPWKFIIIGRDDGMRRQLQKIVVEHHLENRVQFVDSVFGDRMTDIMRAADVFLFTSRSEGLPMAALDACAAQLPSILSPECNVPEIGEQGAGIVLEKNTPENIAAAVTALSTSPKRRAEMRRRCHQVIRTTFNLELIAKQLLTLYVQP